MTPDEFHHFDVGLEEAADIGHEVLYMTTFIRAIKDGKTNTDAVIEARNRCLAEPY